VVRDESLEVIANNFRKSLLLCQNYGTNLTYDTAFM
jgi:hypothetical protein